MRLRAFVALLVILLDARADAASLAQPADHFWAVLASRQDVDEAIASAQLHADVHAVVTRASNGWFAAISGPYTVKAGTGRTFLDGLIKDHGAPADAYLTRGANFDGVAWKAPATNVTDTVSYDGEHDVSFRRGDLTLKLSRQRADGDQFSPTLSATYQGRPAFSLAMTESSSEKPASRVDLVRLDPASPLPQIVFSYYWQGAHCCTVTKIASLALSGAWNTVDGETLDSDGYSFEDLGSGYSYLVSVDNAFLYAFDSYAGSYAPLRIQQLVGAKLIDVTRNAELHHRVLQDVYRMELSASSQGPDTRHEHGFLAGWVGGSLLADRGDAAWKTMLASYSHEESMFGPERCTTGGSVEKCPEDKRVRLPFPTGLRQFLTEHGYITDPNRFAAPDPAEPASAHVEEPAAASNTPPQLQICAGAAGTVRQLVYQTFVGRKMRNGESEDAVSVADNATLEGYDAALHKVTCAVDYTITLRPLIGVLGEEGNLARAASLGRLSRQNGGSVSNRIKYTVKPTASASTQYVELLP